MRRPLVFLLLIFMLSYLGYSENLIAIKAKQIVTVSGESIMDGTLLIKGDKIEKLGKNLMIPENYKVYHFPQGYIYPGIINLMTPLGLTGISRVREWQDYQETGQYKPQISAFTAFYPWGKLIPITRSFGTLVVLTALSGGVISGKAALVNLDGWSPKEMFIKKEAALIVRLPESSSSREEAKSGKTDFSKDKMELKDFFSRAHRYYLRGEKGKNANLNPKFEAMKALWQIHLPVIVLANKEKDIKFAIELGKELHLNMVLYSVYEGEKVVKEIKSSGYPVILSSLYSRNRKWEDGYDKVYRLPAALYQAGIKFAFSTHYAPTAFDLPIQAARSVAYGLPPNEALKALTQYPAEIIGLKDYGTIEKNKVANLVVTSGNILNTSTTVKKVFIKGSPIETKSQFQLEYDRAKIKSLGDS
jgi:imidazolonepropionase-like amidohydrolase